jgi:pimeloyl-ACP methyl ester carboxylesterase
MVREMDIQRSDGRTLHVYDTGPVGADGQLAVVWHHGTPNIGSPPEPLFAASERLGIRWVAYDRPGYGRSTPRGDRNVATAADEASAVADALGIGRFAVMGHSGGGPHALACGALLPERVLGVVSVCGLAPFDAEELDYFAGMADAGVASLGAAAKGREARERHEATADGDADFGFIPADIAALEGEWSWFHSVVRPALENGPGPLIDDDLASVSPWGFDPAWTKVPTLILHGGSDRVVPGSHGEWLARHCPSAELWLSPEDGHISILHRGEAAMEWLRERAPGG